MTRAKLELAQEVRDLGLVIEREAELRLKKRLKWLRYLAVGLGVLLLVTAFVFNPLHRKRSITQLTLTARYQAEAEDYHFKWTLEDFDKIHAHDTMKGTAVETIITTYGKPSRVYSYSGDSLHFDYEGPKEHGSLTHPNVSLSFRKMDDGYYLSNKSFRDFPIPETLSLPSNPAGLSFSPEAIRKLAIGSRTGLGGESLMTILETYRTPDQLSISQNNYNSGREIEARYRSNHPEYSSIDLTFVEAATGDWLLVREDSYFSSED